VQPNVAGRFAAERECHAFVGRYCRLGEGHAYVARSANENHPMILNKTDGRQRFASSSGRNIQNQIRSGISTGVRVSKETEQPFLMIVEGNVAILENVFVLLDELVGISNNVRQDRFGIHRGYANINKVQHMFVDIFHCYVAQLDERVQVKGVVTVFFHVKKRQHFFDEAEEDELDDVWSTLELTFSMRIVSAVFSFLMLTSLTDLSKSLMALATGSAEISVTWGRKNLE